MKTGLVYIIAALAMVSTPALAQEPRAFATAPQNQPILAWVQEGTTPAGTPIGFWSFIIWQGDDKWQEIDGTSWAGALPLYWLPLPEAPAGSSWE